MDTTVIAEVSHLQLRSQWQGQVSFYNLHGQAKYRCKGTPFTSSSGCPMWPHGHIGRGTLSTNSNPDQLLLAVKKNFYYK
jgi:hypothetical protein